MDSEEERESHRQRAEQDAFASRAYEGTEPLGARGETPREKFRRTEEPGPVKNRMN
jgi:hypothetical protein